MHTDESDCWDTGSDPVSHLKNAFLSCTKKALLIILKIVYNFYIRYKEVIYMRNKTNKTVQTYKGGTLT
uniref:Uncharacterized protein n=1 Tax=Virgibacillus oceani TaxID=1479511 RepID=A0A917HLL1_9BACI|nr:hypothetical protein GCM10011398_30850 [Virgibacillus oceani]